MSHLTLCGGSTRDQDPAPDPYLCCTFWASPPSQLQSHVCLTLDLVGQSFWVPTILHYLHKWTFHPIFLFYLNIICSCVYISHNFYFSSAIFIALNDHLELTVLSRHSLLQRLNWYVFLFTIIGQFHLLLWTPFFFFFMYMADICSWGTICTFLQLLLCKVFITIWVPNWGQFLWGVNSRSIFGL